MKVDKRTLFAIGIVLLIFVIILVYEWGGAWKGYKSALEQSDAITAQLLEAKDIPIYMLIVVTIIDYVKHSWLCLLLAFIAAGALQEFVPKDKVINFQCALVVLFLYSGDYIRGVQGLVLLLLFYLPPLLLIPQRCC